MKFYPVTTITAILSSYLPVQPLCPPTVLHLVFGRENSICSTCCLFLCVLPNHSPALAIRSALLSLSLLFICRVTENEVKQSLPNSGFITTAYIRVEVSALRLRVTTTHQLLLLFSLMLLFLSLLFMNVLVYVWLKDIDSFFFYSKF